MGNDTNIPYTPTSPPRDPIPWMPQSPAIAPAPGIHQNYHPILEASDNSSAAATRVMVAPSTPPPDPLPAHAPKRQREYSHPPPTKSDNKEGNRTSKKLADYFGRRKQKPRVVVRRKAWDEQSAPAHLTNYELGPPDPPTGPTERSTSDRGLQQQNLQSTDKKPLTYKKSSKQKPQIVVWRKGWNEQPAPAHLTTQKRDPEAAQDYELGPPDPPTGPTERSTSDRGSQQQKLQSKGDTPSSSKKSRKQKPRVVVFRSARD
ncbi:uncharacterized protein EI97DRAFT_247286 [Westerdykella ornata]|uniref:Uncharacterized protein n=1 Tax=Westerdykella ornata TaxID=318751 RepID=A0A6A6JQJ3_WESOR|nr:uncharacterized protein EI97DRAFT_247286 [Westerdykella ornata]KAF2278168.1 hypothetical protein EI97DRAFT_247286 [Westerdykella ornata]